MASRVVERRRHGSTTTVASGLARDHSTLSHSSLNFPLKLSSLPFCHALPGSMRAASIPSFRFWDPEGGALF